MESFAYVLWIILGVILIIAEIFTLGFVLLWFGIGAMAAALVGWLGFGLGLQFLVFAGVAIALTALSRTIFVNYFSHDETNLIKTGVDALPGQIGTVTISSKGAMNEGAVKVFGSTWTAFPVNGEEYLQEGEKVEVVRVKGSSIFVQKIDERKLPEWRE